MDGVVINGVEVFGPSGCGLPVVGNGQTPVLLTVPPPPEFAPTPPATPSPIRALQPHPAYPPSYPPLALGRPTETGPRKVPVTFDSSYYIVRSPNGSSGDMLENEFATNGIWGVVDWAQRADNAANVPWDGITNKPSHLGNYWWVGGGPPSSTIVPNALPGDLYLDSVTGDVYQLQP